MSRIRCARLRKNAIKNDLQLKQGFEALLFHRHKSVLLLIRAHRVWKFRRAVLDVMNRIGAVKMLQRNWRNKLLRLLNMANLTTNIIQGTAAVKIQRSFRGYCGRKVFRKKKMIATQASAERRFDTVPSTLMANFEMHGSAKILQVPLALLMILYLFKNQFSIYVLFFLTIVYS
jgi:hypothetical protein